MPTYKVTSPSGKSLRITGNKPPSEQELNNIFSSVGDKPKQSFGQKALAFGKGIVDQATGLPRMINEIGRGARNAPVLSIQEKQLSQLRQQPLTAERVAKEEQIANTMKGLTKDTPFGLSAEDKARVGDKKWGEGKLASGVGLGLQRSAGTGSFLVPGMAGAKLGTRAASGMTAGGLSGASQGDTVREAATGAGMGMALGATLPAVTHAIGKGVSKIGSKLGRPLERAGEATEVYGIQKTLGGKPAKRLGGVELYNSMDDIGISYKGGVDELVDSAKTALKGSGDELQQALKTRDVELSRSTLERIRQSIASKIKGFASTKNTKHYTDVLAQFDEDVMNMGGSLKLSDLNRLRAEYGAYTKPSWNASAVEKQSAKAYNYIYNELRSTIDDVLKIQGFNDLLPLNKNISTAIRALDYADDLAVKGGRPQGINFADQIISVASYGGTGAALPALAISGGSKFLRSGAGMRMTGNVMSSAGRGLQRPAAQIPPAILRGATIGGTRALDNPYSSGQDMFNEKPRGSGVNMNTGKNPYKNKVNVEYKF